MTPEELEKLRTMQRGMAIFMAALTEVASHPQDMNIREAVAKRGRQIIVALDDLCNILESKSEQNK